jgi:hypothetical protein
MTAEQELAALKAAIVKWSEAKTFEEGCRMWSKVAKLAGIK